DVPEQHPHEPDVVAGSPNGATAFDALDGAGVVDSVVDSAIDSAVDSAVADPAAALDGASAIDAAGTVEAFGERDIWDARVAGALAFLRRRLTGQYDVDEFGFDPELNDNLIQPMLHVLYRDWFRVEVSGAKNVPLDGPG